MGRPEGDFGGYGQTCFTTIPDMFMDFQMQELGEAEIKVMLYIFRRTYGWKKRRDAISYNQFLNGIVTRDGRQLDRGAGVSRSSLWRALKGLCEKGYIFAHNQTGGKSGEKQLVSIYELNIDGKPQWSGKDGGKGREVEREVEEEMGFQEETGSGTFQIETGEGFQDETGRGFKLKQGRGFKSEPTINSYKQQTDRQQTTGVVDAAGKVDEIEAMAAALGEGGFSRVGAVKLAMIAAGNGRPAEYIVGWRRWLEGQAGINSPQGFLNRMIRDNEDLPAKAAGIKKVWNVPKPGEQVRETRILSEEECSIIWQEIEREVVENWGIPGSALAGAGLVACGEAGKVYLKLPSKESLARIRISQAVKARLGGHWAVLEKQLQTA